MPAIRYLAWHIDVTGEVCEQFGGLLEFQHARTRANVQLLSRPAGMRPAQLPGGLEPGQRAVVQNADHVANRLQIPLQRKRCQETRKSVFTQCRNSAFSLFRTLSR